MRPCNFNLKISLELSDEMLKLAEKGDLDREDSGCGILYGIIRDCAFKIRKVAEEEVQAHKKKGWWKDKELNSIKK